MGNLDCSFPQHLFPPFLESLEGCARSWSCGSSRDKDQELSEENWSLMGMLLRGPQHPVPLLCLPRTCLRVGVVPTSSSSRGLVQGGGHLASTSALVPPIFPFPVSVSLQGNVSS